MIKYICDICNKEFQPYRVGMGENAFSNFSHYEVSKVLTGGQPEPKLKVISKMLCSDCGAELNKKVGEIEKQNESKKEK